MGKKNNPASHRSWCIELFRKYCVEEHLLVLTLLDNLNLDNHSWGTPNGNPYFYELMDCSRVLYGQLEWEDRIFFLDLLDQFLQEKISICDFQESFKARQEFLEVKRDFMESQRDLRIPDSKAAIIFCLMGEIYKYLDEEFIFDYCLGDTENIDLEFFRLLMFEIQEELKELIQSN